MLKCANEDTFYDIFIMADLDKFSNENMGDLRKFESHFCNQCKINFIDMKGFGEDFAIQDLRFNFTVYYRLFIHKYILQYNKVIFSDVDILILKDLSSVFSTNIDDYFLAATKQTKVNTLSSDLYKKYVNKANTIKQENYFNAGFLILNIEKIRGGNYEKEFIRLAKLGFNNNDQDILNLVFQDQVKYLSIKHQYIPIGSYFNKIDKSKLLKLHTITEIEEQKKDPTIIHYLSTKPWNIRTLDVVSDLELDKYQLWWDTFYECLNFINKKAIYQLYLKLNKNILTLGDEYCKEQTIPSTIKRLISLISKKLGIHSILKSMQRMYLNKL
jgi:lipopolysaccharide biosynthesis glycosyltransferase